MFFTDRLSVTDDISDQKHFLKGEEKSYSLLAGHIICIVVWCKETGSCLCVSGRIVSLYNFVMHYKCLNLFVITSVLKIIKSNYIPHHQRHHSSHHYDLSSSLHRKHHQYPDCHLYIIVIFLAVVIIETIAVVIDIISSSLLS